MFIRSIIKFVQPIKLLVLQFQAKPLPNKSDNTFYCISLHNYFKIIPRSHLNNIITFNYLQLSMLQLLNLRLPL